MPFGTITVGSETFEPARPGVYPKSGTSISSLTNELRFSAASKNTKAKRASIGVTALEHQSFTPPGSTVPVTEELVLNISINMPTSGSFTETEVLAVVNRAAGSLTADRIRRMLLGEN